MGFALKTASFSRRKALYHQLGIKDKDPEVNSYIQSLMQRIIELETEVSSLRTRLDEYECCPTSGAFNRTQPLSRSVQPSRGEVYASSANKVAPGDLKRSAASAEELECSLQSKKRASEVGVRDSYVSRAFRNEELHRKMKEDIIRKVMMSAEAESYESKDGSEHSLSNFDPAKVSNQYYEVSETERREVELIKPTQSELRERPSDEFNIILLESFESGGKSIRDAIIPKASDGAKEPTLQGRVLEGVLNEMEQMTPVHKHAEKTALEEEDIMAEKFELQPVSSRVLSSITMNWRKDKENISFEVEELPDSEGVQMEVMTSKYLVKNTYNHDSLSRTYKSSRLRSKRNSVDKQAFSPSSALGERNLNHRYTKTTDTCVETEASAPKPSAGRAGDAALKENRLDPASKRRSLANKFSHVSSQLRSCYQRRPLSSDLFLQDRQSRSRSRGAAHN